MTASHATLDPRWNDDWMEKVAPDRGTTRGGNLTAVVLALGVIAAAIAVALFGPTPNAGFADGAAVIAVVSIAALGIERIIEGFWSLMASRLSGWWPLNQFKAAVDEQISEVNRAAMPVFEAALAALADAKEGLAEGTAAFADVERKIQVVRDQEKALLAQVRQIRSLARDNQRVALLTTATTQAITRVDTLVGSTTPVVRRAFNDASQVTTGALDLLGALKENPGKKMISLLMGALLGIAAAGFVGLDLFAAAGAPLPGNGAIQIGVVLTGLVLGLGSNPTHQVVSFVTDAAGARRAAQLGQPVVQPDAAAGSTAPAAAAPQLLRFASDAVERIPLARLSPVAAPDRMALPEDAQIDVDLSGIPVEAVAAAGGVVAVSGSRLAIEGKAVPAAPGSRFVVDLAGTRFGNLAELLHGGEGSSLVAEPGSTPAVRRVQPANTNLGRA